MFRTLAVSRRFAARPIKTKSIARSFENSEEALDFYQRHTNLAVGQLEPILSQLAFIQTTRRSDSPDLLFKDERFVGLLLQATSDMEDSDSNCLARFAQAISKLSLPRGGSVEVTELARKIGEVACKRVNAFSPATLSQLAYGLGARGVSDPQLIEFVRMETLKMLQDMTPENGIMIIEAFRRMGVFNRELVDNLVERLTDEVDRFTSKDSVNCVSVFAKLGIGRGFLLRRLSRLAHENLSLFNIGQLVKLMSGFARLRFTTTAGVDALLEAIEGAGGVGKLTPAQCADVLFAVAMSNYTGSSHLPVELTAKVSSNVENVSITGLVDAAWALTLMDVENREAITTIVGKIFCIPPPSNRQLLLKALEVAVSVGTEFPPTAALSGDSIPSQWRAAMDEGEKLEMNRFESSRLHAEVLALVESIKPGGAIIEKLAIQRNAQAGLYRVDFLDEKLRLVVDIDTLSRPTTLALKHRHLKSLGFLVVGLGYWDIRRFKTFEEQQEWLRVAINRTLRKGA